VHLGPYTRCSSELACILNHGRLNLTAANHVYILEPQWNPSVESQAIGRVSRLGQNKAVSVTRYLVRGTVEVVCARVHVYVVLLLTLPIRKCIHNRFERSNLRRSDFKMLILWLLLDRFFRLETWALSGARQQSDEVDSVS
jgi:hypothetical protein